MVVTHHVAIPLCQGDLSSANRALETLAKLGGYSVERKESRAEIRLMSLGTAQLRGLLDAQTARLTPVQRERLRLEAPDVTEFISPM